MTNLEGRILLPRQTVQALPSVWADSAILKALADRPTRTPSSRTCARQARADQPTTSA